MKRRLAIFMALIALRAQAHPASEINLRACEVLFKTPPASFRALPLTADRLMNLYQQINSKYQSQTNFRYQEFDMTMLGLNWDRTYHVHWFSESEAEARELRFRDGRAFLGEMGKPLSTTNPLARLRLGKRHLLANGHWDFVMMPDGRIYVTPEGFAIKHTSLSHRRSVAAAGRIQIKNGLIRRIDNMSGHYFPPVEALAQILFQLGLNDVDIEKIEVRDIRESR